jgi:hypothetical protein
MTACNKCKFHPKLKHVTQKLTPLLEVDMEELFDKAIAAMGRKTVKQATVKEFIDGWFDLRKEAEFNTDITAKRKAQWKYINEWITLTKKSERAGIYGIFIEDGELKSE